jgi:hypothetical protein
MTCLDREEDAEADAKDACLPILEFLRAGGAREIIVVGDGACVWLVRCFTGRSTK